MVSYIVAVCTVLGALFVKLRLEPYIGHDRPFLFFFGAITLSAWFGGWGPGLLATALSAFLAYYFFLHALNNNNLAEIFELTLFVLEGLLISWLSGSLRVAKERAEANAQQMLANEAALRESEGRFRHLSESGLIGIFFANARGDITEVNDTLTRMLGYTRDELVTGVVHWPDLTLPPYKHLDNEAFEQLIRTGICPTYEKQCRRKDGSRIWLLSGAAILDHKKFTGVCFVLDITPHKRAEEELSRSRDQLQAILGGVADGITVQNAAGKLVYVNAAAAKLLGYESPQALLEAPIQEILGKFEMMDEAGQPFPLEKLPGRLVFQGSPAPETLIRYRVVATGEERWSLVTATPIRDEQGEVSLAVNILHDITARRNAEAEHQFMAEASALLAASLDYETTLASVARLAVAHLSDLCIVDMVEKNGAVCRLAVAHADPVQEDLMHELQRRYPPAPGLPHPALEVLETGQSVLLPELSEEFLAAITQDENHLRILRDELKFQSAMIVPLMARDHILGAISFISTKGSRRYNAIDLTRAEDLTRRAALAVDNARLYSAAQEEQRRDAFLAQASAVLASSLDYKETLASVARLVVPQLADWCVVDIIEENESLRRVAVAHVDPAKVSYGWAVSHRYPNHLDDPEGIPRVIRSGKSAIFDQIPEALLQAVARDAEHLNILRELYLKSGMVVPLVARDRTLGAISFGISESERLYTEADLNLAENLARRAALAVDNARLYGEAQEANRAKDVFLATLSHELRTPLTAMVGWIHLLRSGRLDETMTTQALEAIERNTKAQTQLIEDLLEVSRAITGKLRLELRAVDLQSVIEAALESVRPSAEAKEITLRTEFQPDVSAISGDPHRLQQVVLNLLSNAIKFTPTGGWAVVELSQDNDWAYITVRDNGKGINPEFLPHVFDRFRQADSSMTRAFGGLGLGLAIVHHLVELHGGKVRVQSEGEGHGATFVVQLPRDAVQDEATTAVLSGEVGQERTAHAINMLDGKPPTQQTDGTLDNLSCPPSLAGLHVLVVDDEPDARFLVSTILTNCDAEVVTVASVAQAMEAIDNLKPDILLSDIGMPDEDGYALIRRVRALKPERGGTIPALAVTAYAKDEDRAKVLRAGYQQHIAKPLDPEQLVTTVANLVRGVDGKAA